MTVNVDLLRMLTQTPGIPSREDRIRDVVAAEMAPLVDDLSVDRLGNLTGIRHGDGGPTIVVAAHIDEIGFLVRHIDDNGFIRLQPVGGFDPRVLVAQRVHIHPRQGAVISGVLQPGTKPIHLSKGAKPDDIKLEDLFVDTGLSGDDVRNLVSAGDMVTLEGELVELGDRVVSKGLDDRIGVYVMIEALRAVTNTSATVVAVATTQEEVGLRGATTSAHAVEADIAIALDVTIAADIPGNSPENHVTRLGGGAAIKMFDSSQLPNPAINDHLRDLAAEHGIPFQLEVLPAGGTDAAAYQRSRLGAFTSTISIPTRYVHTVNEMASKSDIQACVDLLAAFITDAGTREYGYQLQDGLVTQQHSRTLPE